MWMPEGAIKALCDLQADLREQAQGSQDVYLLSVADRIRDALEMVD